MGNPFITSKHVISIIVAFCLLWESLVRIKDDKEDKTTKGNSEIGVILEKSRWHCAFAAYKKPVEIFAYISPRINPLMGTSFFSQGAVIHKQSHRIYMRFTVRNGWLIEFFEDDMRTQLPRTVRFIDSSKIFEMHERWGADRCAGSVDALIRAIKAGRGGVWLQLTIEQYRKLLK